MPSIVQKSVSLALFWIPMADCITTLSAAPLQPITMAVADIDYAPIKIAVFDFELEDFSGGASIIPESVEDTKDLQLATDAARRLIAESGRYTLVDVSSANAKPIKIHKLQDCDGCDAAIAFSLGAEQSLIGIVTRITRTDYAVTFKLRDARSAKLIDVEQTDLRIGANYSWDRGAAWLIKNKLLDKQSAP